MFGVDAPVVAAAIVLGFVHGIEPGHGWPVAAAYALEQSNKWLYGLAASLLLGFGHLVSSIAMVGVFFGAKRYFDLTQVNEPVALAPGLAIGGPVSIVAGVVLVALGVREYRHGHHGHSHDLHGDDRSHDHHGHNYSHDHASDGGHDHDGRGGFLARVKSALPFVGSHSHTSAEEAAERGLWGIAGFAFVLGFAHEEEFEIIGLCLGSDHCLTLMVVYALTVIVGIVGLTLLLIAGYQHYEQRVEGLTEYLPFVSATVLVVMGSGFILGVF